MLAGAEQYAVAGRREPRDCRIGQHPDTFSATQQGGCFLLLPRGIGSGVAHLQFHGMGQRQCHTRPARRVPDRRGKTVNDLGQVATVLDSQARLVANAICQHLAGYGVGLGHLEDLGNFPRDLKQHTFYNIGRRIEPEAE